MTSADARTYQEFADRLAGVTLIPDGMGLLTEFVEACSRNDADSVWLRAQTEPDWTEADAQAHADQILQIRCIAITNTMHANGGTLEMVEDLAKAAAEAFGARLVELSRSHSQGGTA